MYKNKAETKTRKKTTLLRNDGGKKDDTTSVAYPPDVG